VWPRSISLSLPPLSFVVSPYPSSLVPFFLSLFYSTLFAMATPNGDGRQREPAWHRRDRRRRAGHRLLAQVSAACVSLASHHGSAPPEILRPLLSALSKFAPRPCDVPWPGALASIGSHRSPKTMLMPNSDIAEVAVVPTVASSSSTLSPLVRGPMADETQFLDIPEVAVVSTVASTSSTLIPILSGGEWRPLPFNTTSTTSSIVRNSFQAAVVSPVASTSFSSLIPYLIDGEWRPLPFNSTATSSSIVRGILAGDFRSLPSTQWASLHDRFPSTYRRYVFRNYVRTRQTFVASIRSRTDSRGTADVEALCFTKLANLFQYALSEDLPYEYYDFHDRFHIVYENLTTELMDTVQGVNEYILRRCSAMTLRV
jgi:hypothetical protein